MRRTNPAINHAHVFFAKRVGRKAHRRRNRGHPVQPIEHGKKRPQAKRNPNMRNPKKRDLQKHLTKRKKTNLGIKQKTMETKKKKSRPKLDPLATPAPKNLQMKDQPPATAPPRRAKPPQGSKLHSHRFAHSFTNLHRLLFRIHLTPQTAAIIFHSRLNRKA